MKGKIKKAFCEAGFVISEEQAEKLNLLWDLFMEGNGRLNLTAITDPQEGAVKHLLDSAMPLLLCPQLFQGEAADIGTGGGFPGLVLAVLKPDIPFLLLDSTKKKIDHVAWAAQELGLCSVVTVHARAEEFAAKNRERFSVVVSRAVAAMPLLSELCLPLVCTGGWLVAYKGPAGQEELASAEKALRVLGGKAEPPIHYTLPGGAGARTLLTVKKISQTPAKYPRSFAKMAKYPL